MNNQSKHPCPNTLGDIRLNIDGVEAKRTRRTNNVYVQAAPHRYLLIGCPKKFVSRLCGCYEGAVDSVFTQLHTSGFNFEFKALYESISQVVADLWQRKGKICGCFKNNTSIVLLQCRNKVSFQRKGPSVLLKFLLNLLKA